MNKTTKIIVGVVVAGLVFFGGYEYGLNKKGGTLGQDFTGGAGRFGGNGAMGQRGNRAGGGMTAGEILSKDATSITLKLRDGGSKIVLVSTSTEVQKMAKGVLDDLSVGSSVSVNGSTNADGSVTAQSVQLRPNLPQGQAQGGKPANTN